VGLARQAKGCFLRGTKKKTTTSLYRFVSWGTANPDGGEAEAEARSAASAQASFPSRRARENKGR
jgi:hypothetical protein